MRLTGGWLPRTAVRPSGLAPSIACGGNGSGGKDSHCRPQSPADWIGDDVFFSGGSDGSTKLWRVAVSQETGRAEGLAQQITSGTSTETQPSVIPGLRVAFASITTTLNIWSV